MSAESKVDLGDEYRRDFAWFVGSFIVWKGATKYVAIRGGLMAAAAAGYTITGEDIVHFPDPVTHTLDGLVSTVTGLDVTPTETLWLPFGYFFEHIHTISTPLAMAELLVFTTIGSGLRRYGAAGTGKTDYLYKNTGI